MLWRISTVIVCMRCCSCYLQINHLTMHYHRFKRSYGSIICMWYLPLNVIWSIWHSSLRGFPVLLIGVVYWFCYFIFIYFSLQIQKLALAFIVFRFSSSSTVCLVDLWRTTFFFPLPLYLSLPLLLYQN